MCCKMTARWCPVVWTIQLDVSFPTSCRAATLSTVYTLLFMLWSYWWHPSLNAKVAHGALSGPFLKPGLLAAVQPFLTLLRPPEPRSLTSHHIHMNWVAAADMKRSHH